MIPRQAALLQVLRGHYFPGWNIVALASMGMLFNVGIGTYAFSLFFVPMAQDLGWSRTAISAAIALRVLFHSLAGPIAGPLVDRPGGAKWVMVVGTILGGAGIVSLNWVHTIPQFYIAYGVLWGIASAAIGEIVTFSIVAKWFVRRRGRAMSLATLGISFGGIAMAPLTQTLLSTIGWRMGWVILGVLTWLVMIPLTIAVMKRAPEDVGLQPDGDPLGAPISSSAAPQEQSWTPREALRTPALWLIIVNINLGYLGLAALLTHLVPYMRDKGLDPSDAAWILWGYAVFAFIAKPMWGVIVERVHVRWCIAVSYAVVGVGYLVVVALQSFVPLFAWAVVHSLAQGGFLLLVTMAWATYYGRAFLGTIQGVIAPFTLSASGIGPLLAGYIYDASKSYDAAFIIFALMSFLGALAMLLALPPRKAPHAIKAS
ncbi:MAG: MFS transporter [Chloroflexi bacterium]|nr:MFS transporter [Chloroflexota bacterium]